jgi:hypothetical protein
MGPGNSQPHKVQACPGSGHFVDVHAVKSFSASCAQSTQQPSSTQTRTESCPALTVTTTTTRVQKGNAFGLTKHGKAKHTVTKTQSTTTPTGAVCAASTPFQSVLTTLLGSATAQTAQTALTAQTAQTAQTSQTSQTSQAAQGVGASASAAQGGVAGASATASSSQAAGGVLGATATQSKHGKRAGGVAGALTTVGNVAGKSLPFTGFPIWAAVLIGLGLIALGVGLRRRGRAMV